MRIYCLSGLGADERIYAKLKIRGAELVHVPWPEYDEHDELPCYAQKVSALIKEDDPVIMGVSLGGMIGVEISKMRPVKKLILISSAKTRSEMPPDGNFFNWLMKSRIVPAFAYKMPSDMMMERFGAECDEDEYLLRAILKDSDGKFMKWAMRAVMLWRNEDCPAAVVHIHGRQDKMIPPDRVHAGYWIEDGGHMMVYNRAKEISHIIEKEIADL